MPRGTLLAFDFGLRYTGVAIGEATLNSTRPLQTIETTGYRERLNQALAITKNWDPVLLVVGLPLDKEGNEQPLSQECRQFAQQLEQLTGIKTTLIDERYTSLEADLIMKERGMKVKDRNLMQHAQAAAIILQSYMESLGNE
ncbi:MAG: Holliday junction resolvase RuvX [Ferrovum sp. 37-45-19]|jgi:putative Holliday junction resolvase|uniref:Holliday junction resolvase RuvX n=1 Tax=Ferrovum sp. JA12 TaxID=1356299 RepID=UPI0007027E84|nr:Holliday junction resolvase RuvX [Ferrovum sp. JA12]OYV79568.1 MAG: Holliday junction resolvase RuvX [Ferrovum sp. 21-44-67]OYV94636.1 MAG: Holliday junction resolvase RuvX [Ferrovum sp. 37-45-19]OZB34539.1 MAG: Holliday junction resolvase RuvX [Ferrovum sp. 34-44-207]HQT81488.1 Holliday junction resolvase RuvX [Ferrovaceae bacterium]KRH79457.1 putative holliday junction resolvase [Ferrovum sp. JA12]